MEPIINPWVFYLIGVVAKMGKGLVVFMAACVGVFLFEGMRYMGFDATEEEKKDALIIYDDFRGEWILEEKKGGRRGKERYALAPSFVHEQCEKKYDVLKL